MGCGDGRVSKEVSKALGCYVAGFDLSTVALANLSLPKCWGSAGELHEENEPTKSLTWPPTIHFYCTQYRGQCYYQSGNFSNTSLTNATSLPLSSTQTLQIGVPQRVLFYQVEYLNGSNQVVATDPMQVVGIP